jgi:hypothetical protein
VLPYICDSGVLMTQHFVAGDNDTVCKDADCQKGTCVANSNNFLNDLLFPYHCDCDPGWTTFQSFLPFLTTSTLPCNIPNCTLNFNCSGSHPSPAPSPQTPAPPPASSDGMSSEISLVTFDSINDKPIF